MKMADTDWNEGDIATNPATGQELVLRNGNWVPNVSVLADMAKSTAPSLERSASMIATLFPTTTNLIARGVNAAGNYASPNWSSSFPGRVTSGVEQFTEPGSYSGVQQKVEKSLGHPLYSAQTTPGKIWEGAVGAAPFGALGEEASIPNVLRALTSGATSEAAGQATAGTPFETPARLAGGMLGYSAPGMLERPTIAGTSPQAGWAQTLESNKVPVSAADITGSRVASSLEGKPPAGQPEQLSNAILQKSPVTFPDQANPTGTFNDALEKTRENLQNTVQGLEKNTALPLTSSLDQGLAKIVQQHKADYGGTSLENPDVEQGLTDFRKLNTGSPMTGKQYYALSNNWKGNGAPELRNMATQLDTAMEKANPAWGQWRNDWANYEGLKAWGDKAGTGASFSPVDPGVVADNMLKNTDMKKLATAGQGILANRPPPYKLPVESIGHVGAGLGALGGLGYGLAHGAPLAGAEEGIYGVLAPEAVAKALPYAAAPVQKFFRSVPGQRMMRNFDPARAGILTTHAGLPLVPGQAQTPSPGQ